MNDSLKTTLTGVTGLTATELSQPVINAISETDITNTGNLLVQIAIAVVTIINLFKRKKKNENTNTPQ